MNDFKDARDRLLDLAAQEERWKRLLSRRCDWEDEVDKNVYRNEVRRGKRVKELDELVPTRHCPICGHLRINLRSWVINRRKTAATCRSCFQVSFPNQSRKVTMDSVIFPESETRFSIDTIQLSKAISKTGLSTREFARRAGWSRSYQRKLENGELKSVNEQNASVILQVLREAGVTTKDVR